MDTRVVADLTEDEIIEIIEQEAREHLLFEPTCPELFVRFRQELFGRLFGMRRPDFKIDVIPPTELDPSGRTEFTVILERMTEAKYRGNKWGRFVPFDEQWKTDRFRVVINDGEIKAEASA